MPLKGCPQGRGGWCRLVQGREEGGMVKPLEFGALVGVDHGTGCLVGRLKREGRMVALIRGLVRKFIRTTARSSGLWCSALWGSERWESATLVMTQTGKVLTVRPICVQRQVLSGRNPLSIEACR